MKKLIFGTVLLALPAMAAAQSETGGENVFSIDSLARPKAAAQILDFLSGAIANTQKIDQQEFVRTLVREHSLSDLSAFGDDVHTQLFGLFGKLKFNRFFSESLQKKRSVDVYLPRKYKKNNPQKYPVIYFLHGAGTNQFLYSLLFKLVLDYHILKKNIEPVIFVLPDGSAPPYSGSFYTNSELYGAFEDYIESDVIGYIEENYNVRTDPAGRFIMGASMGGYGAMKIAARHPEMFRGVVAHSGPHDLSRIEELIPNVLAEYDPEPRVYAFTPDAGRFSGLAFTMAGAFSPNLADTFFVDLPLSSSGKLIPEIFEQWLTHSGARIVKNAPNFSNLAVYFDCGRQDEFEIFRFNTAFADTLDALGAPYRFEAFNGGHYNKLLQRVNISLRYIDSVFAVSSAQILTDVTENPATVLPQAFALSQNFPNPFNPETSIRFSLPKASDIVLTIFDLQGREVRRIAPGKFSSGEHAIIFDASGLASGVYFYRIQAGEFSAARRMVFLE